MKLDIIMFWFTNDWGKYGRAYEKIAENLAAMPEVHRIICFFPPIGKKIISWPVKPVKVENINHRLSVITLYNVLKSGSWPYRRVKRFINEKVANIFFKRFIKTLALKKESTVLWLYPPHKFINQVISKVPYTLLVTQILDNSPENPGKLCLD